MTWLVVGVLGGLAMAFGWAADRYRSQAMYWQAMYELRNTQAETLLVLAEESQALLEEGVVRVWSASEN